MNKVNTFKHFNYPTGKIQYCSSLKCRKHLLLDMRTTHLGFCSNKAMREPLL